MNKEELNNWKDRILNEVGPESYQQIKKTFDNESDIDYAMKVKRIKLFEDYFDQIQAFRWETNLEISDDQREKYKSFFNQIEKRKQNSTGLIKKMLPPFMGAVGGIAATLSFISMVDTNPQENTSIDQFAIDSYEEHSVLENLIKDGQTLSDSEKLTMISPESTGDFSQKITFKWEYDGSKELELELLDNQNISLSKGARFVLPTSVKEIEFNTTSFEPGLYYWKVTQNNELLAVGKFIIE